MNFLCTIAWSFVLRGNGKARTGRNFTVVEFTDGHGGKVIGPAFQVIENSAKDGHIHRVPGAWKKVLPLYIPPRTDKMHECSQAGGDGGLPRLEPDIYDLIANHLQHKMRSDFSKTRDFWNWTRTESKAKMTIVQGGIGLHFCIFFDRDRIRLICCFHS